MQPFSNKTAEVILIGLLSYYISFLIFHNQNGFIALILGSLLYILLFITLVWWRKITPDLEPIILALKNRISKKTK